MWLRRLAVVVLVLVLLPYLVVPLYAVVDPPVSAVMLQYAVTRHAGIDKKWVDLDQVSPNLIRAVLAAEDARFCSHHGVDWVEMHNALVDDNGPMRGASTITMQAARNLFFFNGRNWIRKGLEVPLALYTDFVLSKPRILEIYLNVAEWDSGVYGVAAASQHYFGVPPSRLSMRQASLLAVTLPSPGTRDPAKPDPGLARIARLDRQPGRPSRTQCRLRAEVGATGWPNRPEGSIRRRKEPAAKWVRRSARPAAGSVPVGE